MRSPNRNGSLAACYDTCEMACPYFYPLPEPVPPLESLPLPLGDAWPGLCHASGGVPVAPEAASLVSLCHLGYARGRCSHFPKDDAGPDAVRFGISADTGAALAIHYVLERDHHPFAHGPLSYSVATGRFVEAVPEDILMRQAEAYVESYLRRRPGDR